MRLLYLSCHEVLAYDEVTLLQELGIEVLALSEFGTPVSAAGRLRPALPLAVTDEEDLALLYRLTTETNGAKGHLPREFLARFDAVIVMHAPQWVVQNWERIREMPVVWRTIGQSSADHELLMQSYRSDGLKIVRYSPAERRLPYYAGEDAIVRFYKDPSEWRGYTGERPAVVCFSQFMPRRPLSCNYDTFLAATEGLPSELYGPDNEEAGTRWKGCLSYDQLHAVLRTNRVCFHSGTFPASYTLGFIEAWMTGTPIVAIGRQLFARERPSLAALYELPDFIEHEVDGFLSDDIRELRSCLQCLLAHPNYALQVSRAARARAIQLFAKDLIRDQWREFLYRI